MSLHTQLGNALPRYGALESRLLLQPAWPAPHGGHNQANLVLTLVFGNLSDVIARMREPRRESPLTLLPTFKKALKEEGVWCGNASTSLVTQARGSVYIVRAEDALARQARPAGSRRSTASAPSGRPGSSRCPEPSRARCAQRGRGQPCAAQPIVTTL
jgi:hypothetical protein